MKIRLLYFAKVKEILGKAYDMLEFEGDKGSYTVDDVIMMLVKKYAGEHIQIEDVLKCCLLSLNDEYINPKEDFILKDNDEISIIPPISAG